MTPRPHYLRTYRSDRHRALDLEHAPDTQPGIKVSARSARRGDWSMPYHGAGGDRDDICCRGQCVQGRLCPRFRPKRERRIPRALPLRRGADRGRRPLLDHAMSYHPNRDPLTMRVARTMREATRDPYAWWEHEETPPRLLDAIVEGVCWVIALALVAAMLTAPAWWPR